MTQRDFSAQVDAWVLMTKQRMLAVFKESAQRVIDEMRVPISSGGNMPVVTGFLRASLLTTLNAPTNIIRYNSGLYTVTDNVGTDVTLTLAQAQLGDTIYAVFTANYAIYQEYGTSKFSGKAFVRSAAQNWQNIVDDVVREAKARSLSFGS